MAPFKLKFRMGSSRSTSQEHDPDPQVNEALLNHHKATMDASNSTIDSTDCNSLGSLHTNERKSLLPNKTNNLRMGYINQSITNFSTHESDESDVTPVPITPPPSYEHVLEEKTRQASSTYELSHTRQRSIEDNNQKQHQQSQPQHKRGNSTHSNAIELFNVNNSECSDPDCQENYNNNHNNNNNNNNTSNNSNSNNSNNNNNCSNERHLQRQTTTITTNINNSNEQRRISVSSRGEITQNDNNADSESDTDNRKESIDSTELLIMTAPSTSTTTCRGQYMNQCSGDCQQYMDSSAAASTTDDVTYDQQHVYCDSENDYNTTYEEPRNYNSHDGDIEDNWQQQQQNHHHHQQQQHQQQIQQQQEYERSLTPEIISNKSSKEIYKDLAKQWGITCKMSDGCRCMECQSHYFDCEFDDNEHQKTDGGLGAGTPMFISEVMHGTACNIL